MKKRTSTITKYQCFNWFIWELPGGKWFVVLPYGKTPRRGSGEGYWCKDRKQAEYWAYDHRKWSPGSIRRVTLLH